MFYEKDEDYLTTMNNTIHFDLKELMQNNMISTHDSSRFFTPKEGLLRGNMFKDEYKPYKNLTFVSLNPKNEKEALLLRVSEFDFATTDLGLHLDIYPEDNEAFELFKMYVEEGKKAKEEYDRMYGPLYLNDTLSSTYNWTEDPWPWENDKGAVYV
jgi:hypothetical protein